MIDIDQFQIVSVGVFLRSDVGAFPFVFVAQKVSLCWLVSGRVQHFKNQIPEIEIENTIHAQARIQRNTNRFR